MKNYLIARTRDRTEWAMTEAEDTRSEIYKASDSRVMLAIARFEAPSWEDARRFFGLLLKDKYTQTAFKDKLGWEEIRIMLEKESQHAQMAKNAE